MNLKIAIPLSSLLMVACDDERTAQQYAQDCESVLGPFPDFKYEDAIEIPMTKNGVPLTHESDNPNDCDHPLRIRSLEHH